MKLKIAEEKCWGCQTCEVACKQENQAPEGVKLIRVREDGPRQIDGRWHFTFRLDHCRHCAEPPCAAACAEAAISKREDGVVILDARKCSGILIICV